MKKRGRSGEEVGSGEKKGRAMIDTPANDPLCSRGRDRGDPKPTGVKTGLALTQ